MGGRERIYDDVAPLAEKRTVATWLTSLREGPGRTAALYHFASWIRWRRLEGMEVDPDALIEECLDGTNRTLIGHLQTILEYCKGSRFQGDAHETRQRHFNSIRGFYSANLVNQPRVKLKNGETNGRVKQELTATGFLALFKRALEVADVRERAAMLCVLQSSMDDSTLAKIFNFVAYPQLVKRLGSEIWTEWDTALCPVRIDLTRPKSGERYYSFLDVDAIEALKAWFDVRGAPRVFEQANPQDYATSEAIFLGKGRPLRSAAVGRIFRDTGKRANVNHRNGDKLESFKGARLRYPFHSHECRDTMITLARRMKADVAAANFFAGHCIDKLRYDKSPWDDEEYFRGEYMKIARPWLNPISGKALEVERQLSKKFEERLANLERQMAERLSVRS